MTLMLHTGAEGIEYDVLRALPVPEATKSHVPIPHADVVNMVRYSLGYFGHEVISIFTGNPGVVYILTLN